MRDVVTITRKEAKERGLKRYFTGKPCKRGHIAERRVSTRVCVGCVENKEQKAMRDAAWCNKNKERKAATGAAWYNKNKEKVAARVKLWCANNKDRKSFVGAIRYANNKELAVVNWRRRRARKANAPGSHTVEETKVLLVQQNHCCANPFCSVDLRVVKKHLDHKNPLSRPDTNPTNSIENLQWLCQPCNDSKGAKTMGEWLVWLKAIKIEAAE